MALAVHLEAVAGVPSSLLHQDLRASEICNRNHAFARKQQVTDASAHEGLVLECRHPWLGAHVLPTIAYLDVCGAAESVEEGAEGAASTAGREYSLSRTLPTHLACQSEQAKMQLAPPAATLSCQDVDGLLRGCSANDCLLLQPGRWESSLQGAARCGQSLGSVECATPKGPRHLLSH